MKTLFKLIILVFLIIIGIVLYKNWENRDNISLSYEFGKEAKNLVNKTKESVKSVKDGFNSVSNDSIK